MKKKNNKIEINKVIHFLKKDLPVFYIQTEKFDKNEGKKLSSTWADYIRLNLEHGPLDMNGIKEFMQSLKKYNKDKKNFIYPTVIAELPFRVDSKNNVDANAWIINQLLACGIHGFLLCHAESYEGVLRVAQHMTYAFNRFRFKSKSFEGLRGHGGQKSGAEMWGLDETTYLDKASIWPLFKSGELLLGVKIENLKAFKNYKKVLSVPGISFAEWGPGDMGMALGYREKHDPPYPKKMLYIKKQIQKECKKKSIYFLNAVYSKKEMLTNLDEGVKFMRIPDSDKAGLLANFGRKNG